MICDWGQLKVLGSRSFRLGVRGGGGGGGGVAECVYKRASSLVLILSLIPTRSRASGLLSRVGRGGCVSSGNNILGLGGGGGVGGGALSRRRRAPGNIKAVDFRRVQIGDTNQIAEWSLLVPGLCRQTENEAIVLAGSLPPAVCNSVVFFIYRAAAATITTSRLHTVHIEG